MVQPQAERVAQMLLPAGVASAAQNGGSAGWGTLTVGLAARLPLDSAALVVGPPLPHQQPLEHPLQPPPPHPHQLAAALGMLVSLLTSSRRWDLDIRWVQNSASQTSKALSTARVDFCRNPCTPSIM